MLKIRKITQQDIVLFNNLGLHLRENIIYAAQQWKMVTDIESIALCSNTMLLDILKRCPITQIHQNFEFAWNRFNIGQTKKIKSFVLKKCQMAMVPFIFSLIQHQTENDISIAFSRNPLAIFPFLKSPTKNQRETILNICEADNIVNMCKQLGVLSSLERNIVYNRCPPSLLYNFDIHTQEEQRAQILAANVSTIGNIVAIKARFSFSSNDLEHIIKLSTPHNWQKIYDKILLDDKKRAAFLQNTNYLPLRQLDNITLTEISAAITQPFTLSNSNAYLCELYPLIYNKPSERAKFINLNPEIIAFFCDPTLFSHEIVAIKPSSQEVDALLAKISIKNICGLFEGAFALVYDNLEKVINLLQVDMSLLKKLNDDNFINKVCARNPTQSSTEIRKIILGTKEKLDQFQMKPYSEIKNWYAQNLVDLERAMKDKFGFVRKNVGKNALLEYIVKIYNPNTVNIYKLLHNEFYFFCKINNIPVDQENFKKITMLIFIQSIEPRIKRLRTETKISQFIVLFRINRQSYIANIYFNKVVLVLEENGSLAKNNVKQTIQSWVEQNFNQVSQYIIDKTRVTRVNISSDEDEDEDEDD